MKCFEVVNGFVARVVCIGQTSNEIRLVAPLAIAFDDVALTDFMKRRIWNLPPRASRTSVSNRGLGESHQTIPSQVGTPHVFGNSSGIPYLVHELRFLLRQ